MMNAADAWIWFQKVLGYALPSTGIAFLFSTLLLNRNMEKFKKRQLQELEEFKGEQAQDLERLRHRLSSRISRIHEREFEVLPKAWLMVNDLRGAVIRALDMTLKFYPDFERFSDAKLDACLKQKALSFFEDYQKDELKALEARDRGKYYMDALQSHYLNEASKKHRMLMNYLIENRIFMTAELREKFSAAETAFRSALTRYEIGRGRNSEMAHDAQAGMLEPAIQTLIDDVETAVQQRLRIADAD